MFQKILIANRGEIACRVIKTAQRMGIATVAVYSEVDHSALHVHMADEAIPIGPAPVAASYLAIDRILAACKQVGADAVHPGYGFLSENAEFARALEAAGVSFIGPNAHAIESMGDKICAKKIAQDAGVSILPGTEGAVAGSEEAVTCAEEIGYPVIIKASAGGGGKGMRIARNRKEVLEGFERACSEAASSFGDDRVFIEKFIDDPRHIEIQILADQHGQVIHLNERECSIQRRHQKVIEEAPSPFLDEDMRAEMGRQACLLAAAVGYDSAGTVEFVVSPQRDFYFLEMNTRLQVEHPVTEYITGIDLVEQMIRVAAGEHLGLKQSDVHIEGWAMESRICAEDPYRNFLPSIGRIKRLQLPDHAEQAADIRVDTGVREGSEISVFYDSMIAKLISHGPDRATAVDTMIQALDGFVVQGVEHNIPFLSAVMVHPRLQTGRLSTGFIAEEYPDGFRGVEPDETLLLPLAAAALGQELFRRSRLSDLNSHALVHENALQPDWIVRLNGHTVQANICDFVPGVEGALKVRFDGNQHIHQVNWVWIPGDVLWRGKIDDQPYLIQVHHQPQGICLSLRGLSVAPRVLPQSLMVLDDLMPEKAKADTSKFLLCPMPGLVMSILVKEGQSVKSGEPLAVVEAMKMENVLRAERDVTVARIAAAVGDSLAVDAVMVEFTD